MALRKEKTEMYVGLFVLVGLLIMGTLIIQFGRFSERLREKYEVTLMFPDGGDIVEGSPVRLGGAQVGIVSDSPQLNNDSTGVIIALEIYDGKRIPVGSDFGIATSGLMGDSYIRINTPKSPTGDFVEDGAVIDGTAGSSLSDFTEQGGDLLEELSDAVGDIRQAVVSLDASFQKIEQGVLSANNIDNLSGTLEDFKATGTSIKEAGEKLVPAVEKGGAAMDEAKAAVAEIKTAVEAAKITFNTATEVVQKAEPAVEDFGKTLQELREAAAGINAAVGKITSGEGVLAALINDGSVKRDLESLLSNLNEHGILGYENDHEKRQVEARTQPQSDGEATGDKKSKSSWFRRK